MSGLNMSTYDQFVFNSTQYLHARGLPSNSFSINGKEARALVCVNVRAMAEILSSLPLSSPHHFSPLPFLSFTLTLPSSSSLPLPSHSHNQTSSRTLPLSSSLLHLLLSTSCPFLLSLSTLLYSSLFLFLYSFDHPPPSLHTSFPFRLFSSRLLFSYLSLHLLLINPVLTFPPPPPPPPSPSLPPSHNLSTPPSRPLLSTLHLSLLPLSSPSPLLLSLTFTPILSPLPFLPPSHSLTHSLIHRHSASRCRPIRCHAISWTRTTTTHKPF